MTAAPSAPHVGLVVEGRGDVGAVPMLLRAHMARMGDYRDILGKPVPLHGKGNATAAGGIEGYVATAALRPGCVGVLVVLDADDEPTCTEGPTLLARAVASTGRPVFVAIAERDFEDWIHASLESLELGESAYDAAERGSTAFARLLAPQKYLKPVWQPRLTSRMNLDLAESRSTSLRRMVERFDVLRQLIADPGAA